MYNTIDDVINLIQKSRNVIVLTGAGISKFVLNSPSTAHWLNILKVYLAVFQISGLEMGCTLSCRSDRNMSSPIRKRCRFTIAGLFLTLTVR